MTSDQFRVAFTAGDHILKVIRSDGRLDIAVGLNGENAVLHSKDEIPLANLIETPLGICELTKADHEMIALTDRFE